MPLHPEAVPALRFIPPCSPITDCARRPRRFPEWAVLSWSSDGVDPQPVLQYSPLDRSEELRPLIEVIDMHGAVFAWAVFNADLIHSAASLHTVRRGVPIGRVCNDFARHDGLGLHRFGTAGVAPSVLYSLSLPSGASTMPAMSGEPSSTSSMRVSSSSAGAVSSSFSSVICSASSSVGTFCFGSSGTKGGSFLYGLAKLRTGTSGAG